MNSLKHIYKRLFNMDLPFGQSAFLWGPRKSGKSTYLHLHFKESIFYDLLLSDLSLRLTKTPSLLREEILSLSPEQLQYPIIIDEVQKIPALLDEIHWLIENTSAYFILCGSSARKLKRGAANLLGGRAWRFTFYPLVYPEIPDFNLLQAFNTELIAYRGLKENDFFLNFWRTQSGLEVDFVINKGEVAIEVKINDSVRKSDLKGIFAFAREYHSKKNIVVSLDPKKRTLHDEDIIVEIMPWKDFLKELWAGSIF
jgi:predicted AAA+ superfamily ATPase